MIASEKDRMAGARPQMNHLFYGVLEMDANFLTNRSDTSR
jgi:hypothetical protein